jgi:DNA-binding helix-hairpin-helix protein with protein kinase domain
MALRVGERGMSELLKGDQVVRAESTQMDCKVGQFIGAGAQGEVYRATLAGQALALKWYFPDAATTQQKTSLENLIRKGPPSSRFLWPIELATSAHIPGYGYLMPLREPRFRGIVELMKGRIDPTFRALATAGFELAHSFLQLHSKGLCYRDISFGNLFIDPPSGEILICDNDNVAVDGDISSGGILGTPRFMAPEIVRGESLPGTQSDLFSLAVLLFYLFVLHHPLEGEQEHLIHSFDLPAMTQLYGTEPVFIFHPTDRSNAPVPGYHDNALEFWPIYPQFLRDLFTRAFTDGILDPAHGRVREGEWRAAMIRLRDAILYCHHCGAENFYDARQIGVSPGRACWSCGGGLKLPFRIRVGRSVVVLNHDTRLFPHHVDEQRLYDFSSPMAAISRHPNQPDVWGLKNLSAETWSFQTAVEPATAEIPPGRTVALAAGTKINFGKCEGEIRL